MKKHKQEQQLFESSMVSSFIYMCGYEDHKAGRQRSDSVYLANQQNKFDQLFGDLFGDTGGRFFVIEFKREREDFQKEITGAKAKPMRVALYNELWKDPDHVISRVSNSTWALGRAGHFGAYREHDRLKIEAYGRAVHPKPEVEKYVPLTPVAERYLKNSNNKVPFVYSAPLSFDDFYKQTNLRFDQKQRVNSQGSVGIGPMVNEADYPYFLTGLGLPPKAFDEYLRRMLECMNDAERKKVSGSVKAKKALVGWFSHKLAAMAFIETPLADLLVHYEEAKHLTSAPSVAQGASKPKSPRPS